MNQETDLQFVHCYFLLIQMQPEESRGKNSKNVLKQRWKPTTVP